MNMYDNFPKKLKELPQWVLWKYVPVEGQEKPTKILYSPSGIKASSINPETWGTFDTVTKIAEEKKKTFAGIGFVFTKGIVAIDLDNCFKTDGTLKPWAYAVVEQFPSYIEYSPSKKGLHVLLEGDIELEGRKKDWLEDGVKVGMECYTSARYFTVTGDTYNGFKDLARYPAEVIKTWHFNTFGSKEKIIPITPKIEITLPEDHVITEFMRKARNGPRFEMLFDEGDWKTWGFPSQSEADMSLVSSLMFFCRNDMVTVDRLFRQSKLMRPKWNRLDYREEMMHKVYHTKVMDWTRPDECDEPDDELVIRSLAGVKPTNVRWLWQSRLAKGKITLFQGDPGLGKSQITIYIASVISKGTEFTDDNHCEQGQVLFITAEDDAADTLKPRLMAQNANMDNIFELQWIKTMSGRTVLFNFEKYMDQLKKVTRTLKNLKLIVVDPISAFLGKVDGNASGEVRGLLNELKNLAEELDVAVILITHNNKNSGQKAISRSSGSHAFGAAARMVYAFGLRPLRDGEIQPNKPEFAMAPIKNNLTKDPDSLVYTIESDLVEGENNEDIPTSKIVWHGTTGSSAQEILDYRPDKKKRGTSDGDDSHWTGRGRPPEKFENCRCDLAQLLGDSTSIEGDAVDKIKDELSEYSKGVFKKSLESLGWKARYDGPKNVVVWEKIGTPDEQFDKF
jgi:hypothetical protein